MKWEIVALFIHLHPRYPSQHKLHASPSVVFWVTLGTFFLWQFPSFAGVASKVISTLYFGSKKIGPMRGVGVLEPRKMSAYEFLYIKKTVNWTFGTVHWWIFWNSACWQIMVNSSLENGSTLHAYMCLPFLFDSSCHFHIDIPKQY